MESTDDRWGATCAPLRESGGLDGKVVRFRDACRPARGRMIMGKGGLGVSGHFEQMDAVFHPMPLLRVSQPFDHPDFIY